MVIFVIKKGDYITRNSYGNDTVFLVLNIRGDTVYLKGVYARLYADSPIDDCVSVDKSTVEDDFRPSNFIDEVKSEDRSKDFGKSYSSAERKRKKYLSDLERNAKRLIIKAVELVMQKNKWSYF